MLTFLTRILSTPLAKKFFGAALLVAIEHFATKKSE
jgi:hypothetical protein